MPGASASAADRGAVPALADKADSVANARRVLGQQVSNHLGSSRCSAGSLSQLVSGSSSIQPLVLSMCAARKAARTAAALLAAARCLTLLPTPIPFTADLLALLARMAAGGSFDACTECGQFQTSAWGSTKGDDCWCLSGFFADITNGNSTCSPCPLGTFREAPEADEQPYARYSAAKTQTAAQTQWSLTGDREDDSDGGGDVSRSSCTHCSSVFPGGVTTLLTSSKSARACVCAPGSQAQCDKSSRSHSGASCLFTRPVTAGV